MTKAGWEPDMPSRVVTTNQPVTTPEDPSWHWIAEWRRRDVNGIRKRHLLSE